MTEEAKQMIAYILERIRELHADLTARRGHGVRHAAVA